VNVDTSNFEDFVAGIKGRLGLDLSCYKRDQMLRRIHGSMERSGATSYGEFLRLIDTNPQVRQLFVDRLTINVSELFRNPDHFTVLGEKVLPSLLEHTRSLRVWSAGCSYGAEPVSLVVLIKEVAPSAYLELTASDIDETILKSAAQGRFQEPDMKNVSAERRAKWFDMKDGMWCARQEAMRHIRFVKHNLLADAAPGSFDLIVCRNVVIYFSEDAKAHINRMFFNALKPGGFLFVGGTERVTDYEEIGFTNPLPFYYSKPADSRER